MSKQTKKNPFADATINGSLGDRVPKGDGLPGLATIEGVPMHVYSLDGPHSGMYGNYIVMAAIPADEDTGAEDATLYRIAGALVPRVAKAMEEGLEFPMTATFSKQTLSGGRTGWVIS